LPCSFSFTLKLIQILHIRQEAGGSRHEAKQIVCKFQFFHEQLQASALQLHAQNGVGEVTKFIGLMEGEFVKNSLTRRLEAFQKA
jgi:hypothetical protein